jgi:membrane protease subunit (stomatin/prohibitin family)
MSGIVSVTPVLQNGVDPAAIVIIALFAIVVGGGIYVYESSRKDKMLNQSQSASQSTGGSGGLTCPRCGNSVGSDTSFCPECGKDLT